MLLRALMVIAQSFYIILGVMALIAAMYGVKAENDAMVMSFGGLAAAGFLVAFWSNHIGG